MIGMIARPYIMGLLSATVSSPATISASFPASNLANNDYGRVLRLGTAFGGSGGTLTTSFDLYGPAVVDCIAMLWHNAINRADTFTIQASNASDFSSLVYDSGAQSVITGQSARERLDLFKFVLTLDQPVTARYWRAVYRNQLGGIYQASRLFLGRKALFAYGPGKAQVGGVDLNASVTSEVGESFSQEDQLLIRPVVSLSFNYAKQSEMEQVLGQYTLSLGTSRPALVCSDLTTPYLQDNVAFGRLEQVVNQQSDTYDVWQFECVVTSLGL